MKATMFLLTLGVIFGCLAMPVSPFVITAPLISAFASSIIAGSSVASVGMTAGMTAGYGVTCTFEIHNWTRWPLMYPIVKNVGGYIANPPFPVMPGTKEMMVTRKTGGTATGTYGTVTWSLNGTDISPQRVLVMWSTPFNHDHYMNHLGVGLAYDPAGTMAQLMNSPDLFNRMYYNPPNYYENDQYGFNRRDYYYDIEPVRYSRDNDLVEVWGTMSQTHQAIAKIIVSPKNEADLAPNLKESRQQ